MAEEEYEQEITDIKEARQRIQRLTEGKEERLAELKDLVRRREVIVQIRDALASFDRDYESLPDEGKELVEGYVWPHLLGQYLTERSALDRMLRALDLRIVAYPDRLEFQGTLPGLGDLFSAQTTLPRPSRG